MPDHADIFERLKQDHDLHRDLFERLGQAGPERDTLFVRLTKELKALAAAE